MSGHVDIEQLALFFNGKSQSHPLPGRTSVLFLFCIVDKVRARVQKWTPKIGQCYKVESGLIKRIPKHGQTT